MIRVSLRVILTQILSIVQNDYNWLEYPANFFFHRNLMELDQLYTSPKPKLIF